MTIETQIADAVAAAVRPMIEDVRNQLKLIQSAPISETYNPDRLYTDIEASELLKVPVQTLRMWRSEKREVPFVKLGSSARYRAKDIRAYLDRSTMKIVDEKGRVRG
ncbi:MAG: helix-turn-helix domain-containing protein [Deferribacterales bacterium]